MQAPSKHALRQPHWRALRTSLSHSVKWRTCIREEGASAQGTVPALTSSPPLHRPGRYLALARPPSPSSAAQAAALSCGSAGCRGPRSWPAARRQMPRTWLPSACPCAAAETRPSSRPPRWSSRGPPAGAVVGDGVGAATHARSIATMLQDCRHVAASAYAAHIRNSASHMLSHLAADGHQRAVKGREQPAPHGEAAAYPGRLSPDGLRWSHGATSASSDHRADAGSPSGERGQQASGTVAAHLKAAAKARVAGRVAHALEQVPQAAACARSPASQRTPPGPCAAQGSCAPSRRTNCAHPERPAYVVQHSVGAGLAPVVYAGGRHPAALSGSRPSSPLPLLHGPPRSTASAQP